MKQVATLLVALFSFCGFSQNNNFAVNLIPDNLKQNANAVVRLERINVDVSSQRSVTIKRYRVVTVLNEYGLSATSAGEARNVRSIGAVIYNAAGEEIKKLRRKDFREYSASEGYEITDDRYTVLNYTPTTYPFTIAYESEIGDSNTAFLPQWDPSGQMFVSVEKAIITVTAAPELKLKYKECNFAALPITKEEHANRISFSASGIEAFKAEQFSPSMEKFMPRVLFGLDKFYLEGVDGHAETWEQFSSWLYSTMLVGSDVLSTETVEKIKGLVGGEKDPIKKAKIIYQYVQDKCRYVSIQLGIGGWKPMRAKDVDRLGYGDCKALTNYTRTLLEAVGVPSYYAVIYGGTERQDLQSDFVSMQGNHIILAIPNGEKLVWLECTSQTIPFAFLGNFTDDRLALLVKPSGGGLVRTTSYSEIENLQFTKGNYSVTPEGAIVGTIERQSYGLQYNDRYSLTQTPAEDLNDYYKKSLHINNLKIKKTSLVNDKEKPELKENILIEAAAYAVEGGGRLIFPINAYNQNVSVPVRYRTRNNPFEISVGFTDRDEVTINLPEGFNVEAMPEKQHFSDKFGEYSSECIVLSDHQLLYKRTLAYKEGAYDKADYENFRKFTEQIAKADNSKLVLLKSKL